MSAGLRLGVLDQSPIISGHTPAEAVRETIALAVEAEKLGYSRYWLAEHHAITALADPCPEILVAAVAAATSHIRVGTGGVLLPYYSPLKTAEVFRMLEALYPGRIDLGIGRAPGGDMTTARAMGGGQYAGAEDFPAQVQDLVGFLECRHLASLERAASSMTRCPPTTLSHASRQCPPARAHRRYGCSVHPTTAARLPHILACVSASPISSAPRAATR